MKGKNISVVHIVIGSISLDESDIFWKMLGFVQEMDDELVEEQGVKVRYLSSPNSDLNHTRIELLEPTGDETPIGRFLSKKGPGVQQICIRVENLKETLELSLIHI